MKVALVHDYIKEYGGAERVLEALHEAFPDAPVFTSVYLPEFLGPHRDRFENWDIRTSWLQYVPFKHKLISPFRLLAPLVFRQLDLSDYDVVIVSATGAYVPNMVKTRKNTVIARSEERATRQSHTEQGIASPAESAGLAMTKREGAIHISYCHTPPRYLYGYATARDWKKYRIFAFLGAIANHVLRMVDFWASKNVDYYIANSEEVAGRIFKFYRKKASVIYPPVEIPLLSFPRTRESRRKWIPDPNFAKLRWARQVRNDSFRGYYLAGGRLARAKGIEIIVKAFNENGKKLKIFGKGFAGFDKELLAIAKKNIEFVGEVTDEERMQLMTGAKAYIFASFDEDFGITPVESMAVGTPIIAFRSGGVRETVLEGKTGTFFEQNSPEAIDSAIGQFEKMKIDPLACRKQAEKFSNERFRKEIKEFVDKASLS